MIRLKTKFLAVLMTRRLSCEFLTAHSRHKWVSQWWPRASDGFVQGVEFNSYAGGEKAVLMRDLELVNLCKYRRSFSVTVLTGGVLAFARLKTTLSVRWMYCRPAALHRSVTGASLRTQYLILSKEPSVVGFKKSIWCLKKRPNLTLGV